MTANSPSGAPTARKRSVALAIRDADGAVLLVRRPPDDEELPGVWGLPAASLARGESWEDAAHRAARGKLGVEIDLRAELRRGEQERPGYRLEMRLLDAAVRTGKPAVPGLAAGVTHYDACRWGRPEHLRPAAERGSLCARLMLDAETRE
jgi:hypothetical protein